MTRRRWREETIMRNATLHIVLTAALLAALGSGCSKMSGLFGGHHHGDSVAAAQLDLNTTGRRELARLRGLTEADVERIIKNRPYGKKHERTTACREGRRPWCSVQLFRTYGSQWWRASSRPGFSAAR